MTLATSTRRENPRRKAAIALVLVVFVVLLAHDASARSPSYGLGLFVWSPSNDVRIDGELGHRRLVRGERGQHACLAGFTRGLRATRVHLYVGSGDEDWRSHVRLGRLPDESGLRQLVRALRASGARTYGVVYLHDDPEDFTESSRLADYVSAAARLAKEDRTAALAGLLVDQEVSTRAGEEALVELVRGMRSRRDAIGVPLRIEVAVRPRWLVARDPSSEPFVRTLAREVDGLSLMDYTNDAERLRTQGDAFLRETDAAHVSGEITIEVSTARARPEETMASSLTADPRAFRRELALEERRLGAHPSFVGLAIHHYAALFEGLSGTTPWDAQPPSRSRCASVGARFRR